MKNKRVCLALLLLFSFLTGVCFSQETADKTVVALSKFSIIGGDPSYIDTVYKSVYNEMLKNRAIMVMSSEEMEMLLKQNNFKDINCKTNDCLSKIGVISKADKIVLGSITKTLERFTVEIKIFDVTAKDTVSTDFIKIVTEKDMNKAIVSGMAAVNSKLAKFKKGEDQVNTALNKYNEIKKDDLEPSRDYGYVLGLGATGFYNTLIEGYKGYANSGIAYGVNAKVKMLDGEEPGNFIFNITAEVFPLSTPEGTYGTSEDIMAIGVGLDFTLSPKSSVSPYIGIGFAGYLDTVRIDSVVTGPVSYMYFFVGFNGRAGLEFSLSKNISLLAEAKIHYIFEPGKGSVYFAVNACYGGGLIYYF